MSDPVLHLLAGPNGAGKTTLYERAIGPSTHLAFVNADRIATERWPGNEIVHAYDAARLAAVQRAELIADRRSFVTETVFSHASKVDLVAAARRAGYLVTLHVVMVPAELAVLRVGDRAAAGGHDVPRQKILERWDRLWAFVAAAIPSAGEVVVYDNADARRPYRLVAHTRDGAPTMPAAWPHWAPGDLVRAFDR